MLLNYDRSPEESKHQARSESYISDEAFLYAEEHVHQTKEEPIYMKQACDLEKQFITDDTLIESLLCLLIQMSESDSHQVRDKNSNLKQRKNLENANSSQLLSLIANLSNLRSEGMHLNRNKLSNAIAMLLKTEFEGDLASKSLILGREDLTTPDVKAVASIAEEEETKEQQKVRETRERRRMDSIRLQLLLTGTMRLIASSDKKQKPFIVHLLKGLFFKDAYFKKKGSTMMKK